MPDTEVTQQVTTTPEQSPFDAEVARILDADDAPSDTASATADEKTTEETTATSATTTSATAEETTEQETAENTESTEETPAEPSPPGQSKADAFSKLKKLDYENRQMRLALKEAADLKKTLDNITGNPKEIVKAFGLTRDQLMDLVLADEGAPQQTAPETKDPHVSKLEERLQQMEQQLQTEREQSLLNHIATDIQSKKDNYQFLAMKIKKDPSIVAEVKKAANIIAREFGEKTITPEIYAEALSRANSYFEQEYDNIYSELTGIAKYKATDTLVTTGKNKPAAKPAISQSESLKTTENRRQLTEAEEEAQLLADVTRMLQGK
jgi:hypothetical protein